MKAQGWFGPNRLLLAQTLGGQLQAHGLQDLPYFFSLCTFSSVLHSFPFFYM
jgi:hypothetical protein